MIDSHAAERILQADLANIIRKVKEGKTLSKAERDVLARHRAQEKVFAVSAFALSERLDVDRRTLNRWAKDPTFPKKTERGYDLEAVQTWIAANGLKSCRSRELNEEKKRLEIEKIRLDIEIRKGVLVEQGEVQRALGQFVFTLKTMWQGSELRLAQQVAGLTPAEALELLRKERHEILSALSHDEWLTPPASSGS